MFGFKMRSATRDLEADLSRFQRIQATLGQVMDELQREKAGLRKRYSDASADAALVFEAMPEGESQQPYEAKLDVFAKSIQNCERRINFIDAQIVFVSEILISVRSFCGKHAL